MSFALYGPIKTFARGAYGPEMTIQMAGDKLLVHRQDNQRFSLCDLDFNEITLLKLSIDFARIHPTVIHRIGKNPEHYSGYGDGQAPRCPKPYGTCASEMERYVYGSTTTELLCPNENCEEGNVHEIYYDARTGKLLVNTAGNGNKLYLIDPDTKAFTNWKAREGGMTTHFQVKVIIHDDNYLYVAIKRFPPETGSFEIRRYRVDEFFANFGSGAIEDYGERIYYEATSGRSAQDRGVLTFAPNRRAIAVIDYNAGKHYMYDPISNEISEIPNVDVRVFGKYAHGRLGRAEVETFKSTQIIDLDTMTPIQTISAPGDQLFHGSAGSKQVNPPFTFTFDTRNIYIYLLVYNNVAPVIEYDHVNRRIRIVDFITKQPIRGELWVWRSRFCYSRDAYPLNITPETLSVSDWTPIPTAYKTECLTFAIKSVTGVTG